MDILLRDVRTPRVPSLFLLFMATLQIAAATTSSVLLQPKIYADGAGDERTLAHWCVMFFPFAINVYMVVSTNWYPRRKTFSTVRTGGYGMPRHVPQQLFASFHYPYRLAHIMACFGYYAAGTC